MAYDAEAAAAAVPPPDAMSGGEAGPAPAMEGHLIAMQDFEAAGSIEERAAALKDFVRQCIAEYGKGK